MNKLLSTLVVLVTFTTSLMAQIPEVGSKAPTIKAQAHDGTTWDSNNYFGKKFIVIYFYPAAMTGGCTKQACAYRDLKTEFNALDAVVVGVSGDNVEGLALFKKIHNLNFPLLSDESGKIASDFGVPMRNGGTISREMEGQKFELARGNTAARWTYIIDKQGKIVYKNTQVDPTKDSQEILDFIKNNS